MDIQVGEAGWRKEDFSEDTRGKMLVLFYARQVKHNYRSEHEKRPIFIEKVFIKKLIPGDGRLVIDRPMRPEDMDEFPVEWARWEQKKTNLIQGTPLDAWPILSDTQKAEFRALNIFTVDQFAKLADEAGSRIMGFNDLRAKARAFIMAAQDSELMDKMRAETDAKLDAQNAEMAELRAQIKALTDGKKGMSDEARAAASERMKKMHADKKRQKEQV
tara:strand:- start:8239 stop:8889 length:651 start_codon:yes stop_codon:yes gene_type:complete